MDKESFAVLKAGLESRREELHRLAERIRQRRPGFAETAEGVDSMAYQLHNLYGGFEQLFEEVAGTFENRVEGESYHTGLLRRMKLRIEGIRPALLSLETAGILDELRRFRHLFRHAYTADLDPLKVGEIVDKVPELIERFDAGLDGFLQQLRPE
ncbi:MAG: hypothetical protein OXH50_03790 [Gemmatimonadetes bacterium]|nr:hypothetical protein [Gemmatimonadota bacterium]